MGQALILDERHKMWFTSTTLIQLEIPAKEFLFLHKIPLFLSKAYAKMNINMSDERVKKIISAAPAQPNTPSIMSAPRDKKKGQRVIIIIAALIISLAINVILAIASISKNERINQMENDIKDYKADIVELKNKINALNDSL